MQRELHCRVSETLWSALDERARSTGESVSHIVERALADELEVDHHSIFQVSTSGAVVKGVYTGCVSVGDLRRHGDFGVGTFDGLDGEMIMLDGRCFQARADGTVSEAPDDALTPFAVVTGFHADQQFDLPPVGGWADLCEAIDGLRRSENVFVGIRTEGRVERITVRAACRSVAGVDLVTATSTQAEFTLEAVAGTLVGFWTPSYARAITVAGYHLHFISEDRRFGGHVLDIAARGLVLSVHQETDVHLAIPETAEFLAADLRGDPGPALDVAEHGRPARQR